MVVSIGHIRKLLHLCHQVLNGFMAFREKSGVECLFLPKAVFGILKVLKIELVFHLMVH